MHFVLDSELWIALAEVEEPLQALATWNEGACKSLGPVRFLEEALLVIISQWEYHWHYNTYTRISLLHILEV